MTGGRGGSVGQAAAAAQLAQQQDCQRNHSQANDAGRGHEEQQERSAKERVQPLLIRRHMIRAQKVLVFDHRIGSAQRLCSQPNVIAFPF